MVLYLAVALLTVMLACGIRTNAYFDRQLSRQRVVNGILMAAIFSILTSLAAFRLEVGNDYGTYVVTCHEIFQRGYVVTEPGYNLVVRILYTLSGKEDYLLMFAVFGAAIVAVFLKCFKDQSDNFGLSFFLFMALGIYFRSFNTVRYYFALALSMYSLRYVVDITYDNAAGNGIFSRIKENIYCDNNVQNLIKFLMLIIVAATFHKSVLVVIPMFLIARLKWNKWVVGGLFLIGFATMIFRDTFLEIALNLYPSYRNTVYIEESHSIMENLPIIFRCLLVLLLCIICYREGIEKRIDNLVMYNLNILAVILYITCSWLPLITRIGYYLITPQVILIPNVIMSIKDPEKKKRITYVVIFFGIMYFTYFLFTAHNDGVRVLPYKSWLFYDHRWLNQTDLF